MTSKYPPGKVPWEKIAGSMKAKLPPEVLLGPAAGEDAALVKIGEEVWAVASDPVTFTKKDAGKIAVIINANDVAVRGAKPLYFTAVVLISPQEADEESVRNLLHQIRAECEKAGIALVGGHTEVTPGLPHSIIIGTMLGQVIGRPITTGGLREGDLVGFTKWAGLEGTTILLKEFEQRLRELHGAEVIEQAHTLFRDNWLSIVPEAAAAASCPQVTALHDVTEGGIGEAVHEMEAASGLHIRVEPDTVPLLPITRLLCSDFGMNPFGLIGSGSLLIGCAPEGKHMLEEALAKEKIAFSWIGVAQKTPVESSLTLPRFERDEILKAWMLGGMEACIFDMDGTVIDSKYDWAAMMAHLGVTGGSIIGHLNNLEGEEKDRKMAELHRIESAVSLAAHVKHGAADLLAFLKEKKIKTALVTNNSDENTVYLIEKFGLAFDVVITRDSGLYKPSGAPIAEAARRLGVHPEKILCVGDSLYDILACRDAGCAWVCIVFDEKKLYAPHADLDFPDVESLTRYLRLVL